MDAQRRVIDWCSNGEIMCNHHLSRLDNVLLYPIHLFLDQRPVEGIALVCRHLRTGIANLQISGKDTCDGEPFLVILQLEWSLDLSRGMWNDFE